MKEVPERFYGKYRGTVVDTLDPQGLARLQAVVPDVLGLVPSTWAMPCVPFAGPRSGIVALPPVGAGVWIEFEQGDLDFPVWSGCWWGAKSELPTIVQAQPNGIGQIALVTPGGQSLVLSDLPGPAGGIALQTPSGARIAVTSLSIVIDNGQGATITLQGNTLRFTGTVV
jgi:uncharacterized protein involved in type VI secretion and phage assembly